MRRSEVLDWIKHNEDRDPFDLNRIFDECPDLPEAAKIAIQDILKPKNDYETDERYPGEGDYNGPYGKTVSGSYGGPISGSGYPFPSSIGGAVTGKIASGIGNFGKLGSALPVNVFPSGNPSDIYPIWIGVCIGKGKPTLSEVLDEAWKHCKKMKNSGKFSTDTEKTIIIITDKWNYPSFRDRHEMDFLNYAIQQNTMFYFILVDDYGIKRIPFLVRTRRKLGDLRDVCEYVEDDIEEMMYYMETRRCEYDCRNKGLYQFDFHNNTCYFRDIITGVEHDKKIPRKAFRSFAEAILKLGDLSSEIRNANINQDFEAWIFRVHIYWDQNGVGNLPGTYIKAISKAFENLIAALG